MGINQLESDIGNHLDRDEFQLVSNRDLDPSRLSSNGDGPILIIYNCYFYKEKLTSNASNNMIPELGKQCVVKVL